MTHRKFLALILLVLSGSGSLAAQAVVMPRTVKLDSVQARVQRAVFVLRDSLKFVDAASVRIARDLKTTSDAGVVARARYLAQRCAAAGRAAVGTLAVVSGAARPQPDPAAVQPAMERGLKELGEQMEHCHSDFSGLATGAKVQELRGYGIGRGARVQQAVRKYEAVLRPYYGSVIGERYTPDFAGAGAIPNSP